jgi:MFS family permease
LLTEAAGLAVLAALSPTALIVAAVFLAAANPRRTLVVYLAGAIVMTGIMATIVYLALRAGHVYKPHQHQTRYGLRLGLGLLMLIAAPLVWRRRRRPRAPKPEKKPKKEKRPGLITRLTAEPGVKEAFLLGLVVFAPSATFIAAVQVVATGKESTAIAVLDLIVIIVITLAFVWLPFLLFLFMPDQTTRLLHRLNAWMRAHGHDLLLGALVVAGLALTINGLIGVT